MAIKLAKQIQHMRAENKGWAWLEEQIAKKVDGSKEDPAVILEARLSHPVARDIFERSNNRHDNVTAAEESEAESIARQLVDLVRGGREADAIQAADELDKASVGRAWVYGVRQRSSEQHRPLVAVIDVDRFDWGEFVRDGATASSRMGVQLAFTSEPWRHDPPPTEVGLVLALQGVQGDGEPRVSVERRGGLSENDDYKQQLEIGIRNALGRHVGDMKLNNNQRDPSMGIRVEMMNQWLRALGLPYRLSMPALLRINGESRGAHLVMEETDEVYWERNLPLKGDQTRLTFKINYMAGTNGTSPSDGAWKGAFKPGSAANRMGGAYVYSPSCDTGAPERGTLSNKLLEDFFARVRGEGEHRCEVGSDRYVAQLREVMDVDAFLRAVALVNAAGSWDTMFQTDSNFELCFVLDERQYEQTGELKYKATVAFTDLDSCLGTAWTGDADQWARADPHFADASGNIPLVRNLLKHDASRAYYDDVQQYILYELADPDSAQRLTERLWNGGTRWLAGFDLWDHQGMYDSRDAGARNATYPFDPYRVRDHVERRQPITDWGDRGADQFHSESPSAFLALRQRAIPRRPVDQATLQRLRDLAR